jgi:hypothetical protein
MTRIQEVAGLLVIVACMWLVLNWGIPMQVDQDAQRNAQHREARK